MALNIGDNFQYQGEKPNFERDSFATKAAMKAFPETSIDEGHIAYCAEDKQHYVYSTSNPVDGATGRWKPQLKDYAKRTEVNSVNSSVSELTARVITIENTANTAFEGASARFNEIDTTPTINTEIQSSTLAGGIIVYSTAKKTFLYKQGGKYYISWLVQGIPSMNLYKQMEGRTFICGTDVYVWDSTKTTLVKVTTDLTSVNQSLTQHAGRLEELDAAVFPYSLSVSGGGVFEKGTSQSVTITWSMKKGGSPIVPDSVKINGALVTGTNKVYAGVTTDTTYNVAATKGSVTKTASTSVRFVNPSYLGVVAESFAPSESAIKVLAKGISESKGRTLSGANLTNQKVCYAYPKSLGALTSIKDANNFDYINSYNRSELTINGEAYYVYILKDATSVSGFKQVFA